MTGVGSLHPLEIEGYVRYDRVEDLQESEFDIGEELCTSHLPDGETSGKENSSNAFHGFRICSIR